MNLHPWQGSAAPGGWVRLTNEEGVTVYLRLDIPPDGAPEWPRVQFAAMADGGPVRETSWRKVPFDTVEAVAMVAGDFRNELVKPLPEEASPLNNLESLFGANAPTTSFVFGAASQESSALRSLEAPKGLLTDEFLRAVAAAYIELAATKRAPAPAIAEQTGTPVRTVHRWISEARKRGHLPPGQRGRAG